MGYPDLQWFPKPFGAGDTDGAGSKKVLGNPEVDPASLLVREMAQNSWDARIAGTVPQFEMRLRTIGHTVRDVLAWNVFGKGSSTNLGLSEVLENQGLCAVEVLDRGTKGLGGPTRNDIDPPPGDAADYADFVLTIGAPPEDGYGGGTYGFGKTAAYLASECSTIVIWSRARRADGSLDERLIASAMGSRFTLEGQRYTGRQWWGTVPSAPDTQAVFRVEPAIAEDARTLGEAIFERHFEGDETGTSILILQPKGHEDRDELTESWARAINQNLWPKYSTEQDPARRMHIRLLRDGVGVILGDRTKSPSLEAATRCLVALRLAQSGKHADDPLVQVKEILCGKPKRVVGHLALSKYLPDPTDAVLDQDAIVYMRSRTELVLRSDTLGPTADGLTRWVGVFKPCLDLDPVFARSEPPAHDRWNPSSLEDFNERRLVNTALRRSKEEAESFRNPLPVETDAATGASSTGKVSVALAGLVGAAPGSSATTRRASTGGGNGGGIARPKVEIIGVQPLELSSADLESGRQRTRVTLNVSGVDSAVPVMPSALAVAVDGGVMASEGQVMLERWIRKDGSVVRAREAMVAPGQSISADISYPVGLAIEFRFTVGQL